MWSLNTAERFPSALADLRFRVVILHYSLFGSADYRLDALVPRYLRRRGDLGSRSSRTSTRTATQRFAFIDEFTVDWVYTLLRPAEAAAVYGSGPTARVVHDHPGPRRLGHAPRS